MRDVTGCHPALIHAAMAGADLAIPAWKGVAAEIATSADPGVLALLPRIYRNLRGLGWDDADLQKLRAHYLMHWTRNQRARRSLMLAARALDDAGVEAMALKGMPLLLEYYGDIAARVMADIDILVRKEDLSAARTALEAVGWQAQGMPEELMPFLHAEAFQHPRWTEVDLHWRVFDAEVPVATEAGLWERARPGFVQGVRVMLPSAADLLIMVCYHARKGDPQSRCRWLVDVMEIIRSGRVDWEDLAQAARAAGFVHLIRDRLGFVEREFGPVLPENAARHLQGEEDGSGPASGHPDLEPDHERSFLGLMDRHWRRYRVVRARSDSGEPAAGFLRYLVLHYRFYWRQQGLWALVTEAWRRRSRLRN